MFFSLLASYGVYSVVIDDTTDDSDDDNDERLELEGDDNTDNEEPADSEETGSDTVGQEEDSTIGTAGDDFFTGTDEADTFNGGAGDDSIEGFKGADSLTGGSGWDSIFGGNWRDTLDGGANGDQLWGDRSEDLLFGAAGEDSLYGGGQNDTLIGGAGADTLEGGDGTDYLIDTKGANTFSGGRGDDVLISAGDFEQRAAFEALAEDGEIDEQNFYGWLSGLDTSGADVLDAGGGNDTLFFGAGDTVTGGRGFDTFNVVRDFVVDADEPAVITDFNPGVDVIEYTVLANASSSNPSTSYELSINYEDGYAELLEGEQVVMRLEGADESFTLDDVVVSGFFVSDDDVVGQENVNYGSIYDDLFVGTDSDDQFGSNTGDDTLLGFGGDDYLSAGSDDDLIVGGEGDDILDGHTGNDELIGGSGDDELIGYKGDDLLNGTAADLTTVRFEIGTDGTVIDVQMDNETVSTDGFDLIKGGPDQDILIAGGGDTIDGQDGADALVLVETEDSDDVIAIRSFDPSEDYLLIKYEGDTAPTVTTQLDQYGQGTMIYLDGVAFAQINQPLPADFSLVNAIGLEPFGG